VQFVVNAPTYTWIGLAEVVPGKQCEVLKEGYRAFVPVVAKAPSARAFYNVVKNELKALQLELVRMEDVEHLSERRRKHALPNELESAIQGLGSVDRLAFGCFHTFRDSHSAEWETENHQ
jgi:hypothetical protein